MYNVARAIECLKPGVGFPANTNNRYPDLASDLITSNTGIYVDHPMVTVENIWNSLEQTDGTYYEEWTVGGTWNVGDRVKVTSTGITGPTSFTIYESQTNGNTGNTPSTSPANWEKINLIDEYLDQVKEDAIRTTINDLYNRKKLHQEVKDLYSDIKLYRRVGRIYNREVKSNRFVGFEIVVKNHDYITAVIERIGVQFSEVNPALNLYLYHTSKIEPIKVIPVLSTKASDFNWNQIQGTILKFNSDTHDIGGAFYIGYKESELTGQAITNNRDMSSIPCSTCHAGEYRDYLRMHPYLKVTPIYVNESEIGASNEIWDVANTRRVYNKNWGLNFDISIKCDVSDLFCKMNFSICGVVRIAIEKKILRMLKLNTRTNEIAKRVKGRAADELDGKDNTNNLERQYEKAMKALDFDLSTLQTACVPCKNNGSKVTYGSV